MHEHKRFNLILAFVFAFSLLRMPVPASAQEPNPFIDANPIRNWVHVYDWLVGSNLTLTINNTYTFSATAGQDPWNDNSTRAEFDLNGFDLKAGDLLKVTDGTTELLYSPSNLALTGFDLAADTLSGIGTPGVEVEVRLSTANSSIRRFVIPDEYGKWTVTFSGDGDEDLTVSSIGGLTQPPVWGNKTSGTWVIPSITAYPTRNWVGVSNWPVGSEVSITINDSDPCSDVWQDPMSNQPTSIYFMGLCGYDLKAGDLIKVTDDATPPNERTYTVSDLTLTGFDLASDTIWGIGTPGVDVQVCGPTQYDCISGSVPTTSDGSWTYTFSGEPDQDLVASSNGWLQESTLDGSTSSDWGIPIIVANLTGNWIQVVGPLIGTSLTLMINDMYISTDVYLGNDFPGSVFFLDLGGFDLKAYDNIKVTDNATPPNELAYTTYNLSLTGFDLAADTITGTGAPGVEVGVCLNIPDNCIWNSAIPASDGNWTIKFSGDGDEDLVAGSNGTLYQSWFHQTLFDWEISDIVPNRPPQITNINVPNIPVPTGKSISATATFTDPDINDTHTAFWDWGDGLSSPATVSEDTQSITGFHTYTTAGVYTVNLTLTDAAGETASAAFQYLVIYDPGAGFVTGGGWINSPAGAYIVDPYLTGKATFGFVSRYQKGANVPTGNTEFQFKVANLNFSSTAYDWLVIAGAKAQYKGTGTINGAGDYGFMLTAIDGQINAGDGVDKFRIKIWDKATGLVIYDNQLGTADDDLPSTAIQGGSIVIHK